MPNYTKEDILNNPDNTNKLTGFCGRIVRINLTNGDISYLNTYQYVPEYLGGRMLINRLFWDEVGPEVGAFDEGNKFIFMTGATGGTGIPTGGRSAACAVSPNSLPEQYSWGNIGGWFGTELKYAGYDGLIIEGKAATPAYISIEDDEIKINPAGDLWGMRVHQTQQALEDKYDHSYKSMVIGPAGEHLVRIASITTSNDCVLAKGGFGAVWGSKNLKAITCHGTGAVLAADIEKLKYLRLNMNEPGMRPSPVLHMKEFGVPGKMFEAEYLRGNVACSPGCNQHCNGLFIAGRSAFGDECVNHIEKCVSTSTFSYKSDIATTVGMFWPTMQNYMAPCKLLSREFPVPDLTDPDFEGQGKPILPDIYKLWDGDYDRGTIVNDLCNEYGIDKWDILVWLMTWLGMCQQEGLFEKNGIDFGMPVDVENEEFLKKFITDIVYRNGKYGDMFAEGMARAIRELGYDTFSESIYHGRYSANLGGKRTDIPVSFEAAWGHSVHWQGRGYEGAVEKPTWMGMNLFNMLNTRDAQTVEHFHGSYKLLEEVKKDPYHSEALIEMCIHTQSCADIKDSVLSCEWQSPDPRWATMEAEMYACATGYPMTAEELEESAIRSRLLFRAILIRNHGRTRQMEMKAIWRTISIPDAFGEVAEWKPWNEFVDMYYDKRGWDRETGWPYRETYEKYGLKDVADEMEKIGKLPVRPDTPWTDYGEEPFVLFVENMKREAAERAEKGILAEYIEID